jgi:hypothetical protein
VTRHFFWSGRTAHQLQAPADEEVASASEGEEGWVAASFVMSRAGIRGANPREAATIEGHQR